MTIYLNEYFENYMDNNYTQLDNTKLEKLENDVVNLLNTENEICLNFDGGFGYTNSFIELIINFLNQKFSNNNLSKRIKVISDDEPSLVELVYDLLKQK